MMNQTNYPKAQISDYGYKDYRIIKKIFAISLKVITVIAILMLYLPVLIIALQSFNSSVDVTEFSNFTFKWYGEIFTNRPVYSAILNTFIVSLIAVTLATILGTFIAIGINALPPKYRKVITMLNNIPILNADIVTGLSLMLIFSLILPIYPYFFGIPTLVLAHMFFTLPYVILSCLPKLRELDPNLLDAATDLGIRPVRSIVKVIIPAIKAGIISGMILAFTMSIDDFVISFFTSGNGFDNISVWLYSTIGRKNLSPSIYAFNTLLIVTLLIGLLIYSFVNGKKEKAKKEKKQ